MPTPAKRVKTSSPEVEDASGSPSAHSSTPIAASSTATGPEPQLSARPLRLRAVGFCGWDDGRAVKPGDGSWPAWIEWGVLARPEKQGEPRFPREADVAQWTKEALSTAPKLKLALHLCSSRCEELVLKGNTDFIAEMMTLGFRRFQINATASNNVDSSALSKEAYAHVVSAATRFPEAEFIIQTNEETRVLWKDIDASRHQRAPGNISLLYDASLGRGLPIAAFPVPLKASLDSSPRKFGYAGGIRPENIRSIALSARKSLNELNRIDEAVWLDMESGIRTSTVEDAFSVEKARSVCAELETLRQEGAIVFVDDA